MTKSSISNNDSLPLISQIEELERKIKTLEDEERMWRDRELFMTDLIKDREREIQTLRNILHLMYDKKNKQ